MDVPIPEFLETLLSGVFLVFVVHLLFRVVARRDFHTRVLPAALRVATPPAPPGPESPRRRPLPSEAGGAAIRADKPDPAAPDEDGWAGIGKWVALSGAIAFVYLAGIVAQAGAEWLYHADALIRLVGSEKSARRIAFFVPDKPGKSLFVQYLAFAGGRLLEAPPDIHAISPLVPPPAAVAPTTPASQPATTRAATPPARQPPTTRPGPQPSATALSRARILDRLLLEARGTDGPRTQPVPSDDVPVDDLQFGVAQQTYFRAKNRVLRESTYADEMTKRQNRLEFLQAAVACSLLGVAVSLVGLLLAACISLPKVLRHRAHPRQAKGSNDSLRAAPAGKQLRWRPLTGYLVAFLFLYGGSRFAWESEQSEFVRRAYGYFLSIHQDPPIATTRAAPTE